MNLDVLSLITSRLDESTLQYILSAHSDLQIVGDIALFKLDTHWWHRRTEALVGRYLQSNVQDNDWQRVHNSILKNGTDFDGEQDYGSELLVSVLLQLGANPLPHSEAIMKFAPDHWTREAVLLLAEDGRVNFRANRDSCIITACNLIQVEIVGLLLYVGVYSSRCLQIAVHQESTELVALLLADSQVIPSENDDEALVTAVDNGDLEVVSLLLQDERLNPTSTTFDHCFLTASEYGFTEILQLLLNQNQATLQHLVDCLNKAVMHQHVAIVKLLLCEVIDTVDEHDYNTILYQAVKFSSREIVDLLLSNYRDEFDLDSQSEIISRLARKYKRNDMLELVTSYMLIDS